MIICEWITEARVLRTTSPMNIFWRISKNKKITFFHFVAEVFILIEIAELFSKNSEDNWKYCIYVIGNKRGVDLKKLTTVTLYNWFLLHFIIRHQQTYWGIRSTETFIPFSFFLLTEKPIRAHIFFVLFVFI